MSAGTSALYQLNVALDAAVNCGSGNIVLRAGGAIVLAGPVISASGSVMQFPNLAPPAPAQSQAIQQVINSTVNVLGSSQDGAQQTINNTVNLINGSPVGSILNATGSDSTTDTSSGGTTGAKTDQTKKDDAKKEDSKATNTSDKSGVKNEPVRKLYCN